MTRPDAGFADAVRAFQAGALGEAERVARALLAQVPGHAPAHSLLGLVLARTGRLDEAAAHLERSAALTPQDPAAHVNLGEVQRRRGDLTAAETALRRAVALAPGFAEAHYNLGVVLRAQGRPEEARAAYERATALQPRHARAHYNLGNLLLEAGRVRSAMERFRAALAADPSHADAHNNLGVTLVEFDALDEALPHYREALRLRPDAPDALRNLAAALEKRGDTAEARDALRTLARRTPEDPLRTLLAESVCPVIPASTDEIDEVRHRLETALDALDPAGVRLDLATLTTSGGEPPSLLTYQGRDNLEIKRKWAALFAGKLPPFEPPPRAGEPPHVGFVVTRGHEGVFLKGMRGLIQRLPAHGLRVTVVCGGPIGEAIVRPAFADHPAVGVLALPARFDHALAALRAARFDALHYWEVGTDSANYFLAGARAAPFQCTSWGWPDTSGLPAVDAFLSAEGLETDGAEARYTERLVRLTRLPTYYFRPPVPAPLPSRDHFGLPDEARLYLCAQNLRKVHPDFDALLAAVLRADPGGLVLLIDDAQPAITARLKARLARAMPDVMGRVRFLPRMGEADYLALTARADVALDTLHYGGGANTVYDSFATGTPLVSMPTAHHRSRWAVGAYRQAGMAGAGIADTPEGYVALAVALANDPARRAAFSRQMQAAGPRLFEDTEAVAELARLLGG